MAWEGQQGLISWWAADSRSHCSSALLDIHAISPACGAVEGKQVDKHLAIEMGGFIMVVNIKKHLFGYKNHSFCKYTQGTISEENVKLHLLCY